MRVSGRVTPGNGHAAGALHSLIIDNKIADANAARMKILLINPASYYPPLGVLTEDSV
jgi:hypothetical protein